MIERNKITISFLPHDNDLWEFIQNKKETCNLSEYIRSLIREDVNHDTSFIAEETIVEKILQLLQQNGSIINNKDSDTVNHQVQTIEEMKNTINNLF
ncbi:hypothetical protein [Psychrobacillus lasiicapitis]|uniref:Uncharacterized protein n=1 Tax=Psychrobacillus lasiicapitis TaxID=1636719 RepID=A0A544SZV6_9BACI|nr:hypothetical protein [Psychrobacillus lasiicapitis]TQR10704.1 hypothetical protein FG382_16700 [Psychrobacillus lasiicapitis]GGA43225.1 hypothetical protein GCM10011384_36250 [Psychrobacillus lasiicapitis]